MDGMAGAASRGHKQDLLQPEEADGGEDGAVVLSFEPLPAASTASPTTATATATARKPPSPLPREVVEYDEFGLPAHKARPPPVHDDVSPSDDEHPAPATAKAPAAARIASAAPAAASVAPATAENPKGTPQGGTPSDPPLSDETKPDTHNCQASLQSLSEKDRHHNEVRMFSEDPRDPHMPTGKNTVSEWSHQQIIPRTSIQDEVSPRRADDGGHGHADADADADADAANAANAADADDDNAADDGWQAMPAYASYDMYDDDGRLIARAHDESGDEEDAGAAKGYTRVYDDEDVESVTSMDENTKYLFQESGDDEASRNPLSQMQATKELLTEGQRIAYVGVCRLALIEMLRDLQRLRVKGKRAKKNLHVAVEGMRMWSQKMMVRLYTHMELSPPEQIMIEQLVEHGVLPSDLTPALMQNSRVHNPMAGPSSPPPPSQSSPRESVRSGSSSPVRGSRSSISSPSAALPEYKDTDLEDTKTLSQLPQTKTIDIDLRWTVLCDLFLVLIADSVYDARARVLLERVGKTFDVSWLDICKFEKRVSDALEMQESAEQTWTEQEHLDARAKQARTKRIVMLGLATVGGGLVIGLSGGLLAPVIGAGLAAGFTTIGVAGTSGFLAGAGGTAMIASGAAISGSVIGGKAGFNRTKSVQTFEFKPLHNAKRVNLIVTVSGWMNGKIDDVRLPFSTVDPIMGDLFSIYWEPEMLQSMGQTISILATEALTQTLQQVLGSTILISLMAAIQLPVILSKLSYLLDNPWSVSLDRAAAAGLILADTLVNRNLGVRPVTLVGYSLGARVIYFCLRELSRMGAAGLVQNAYMFGSPIVVKTDEYAQAASMVSGRLVSGYASNDWILGYLFRATSGGIGRIAGLAPVDIPGVENIDVTDLVNGHMAYRAAMPKLLMKVGWEVTSDEFSEIEDPDPENHRARQRELINELDEARKEIEKGSRKRKWNFFGRKQDPTKKNEWETYDLGNKETTATTGTTAAKGAGDTANGNDASVLFDIDAIRAEIEASSKETQVVELESTMPKLRISIDGGGGGLRPPTRDGLRHTKSFDSGKKHSSSPTKEQHQHKGHGHGYDSFELEEHDEAAGEGEIRLEFDPEPEPDSRRRRAGSLPPSARQAYGYGEAAGAGGRGRGNVWADHDDDCYSDDCDDEFAPRRRDSGENEMIMTFA